MVYVLLMDRLKRLFLLFDSAAGRRVGGTSSRSTGRQRRRRRERRRSADCHRTGAHHSRHGESDSYPSAAGGRCFEEDTLRLKRARGSGSSGRCCRRCHRCFTINMDLENIVANTVLVRAREGEDGGSGTDSPSAGAGSGSGG